MVVTVLEDHVDGGCRGGHVWKIHLSHCMSSVAPQRSFDVPSAFFSHIWEIHVYQVALR